MHMNIKEVVYWNKLHNETRHCYTITDAGFMALKTTASTNNGWGLK